MPHRIFSAKPFLIRKWLNAKGYSSSLHDGLYSYFQSKSGVAKGTLYDQVRTTMNKLGFTGTIGDQLRSFFQNKTGISNPKDAERAFWNNTSLDFGGATKFVILDPTDGHINLAITVTVQAQKSDNTVDTAYQLGVTLVTDGSATGGGLVTIVNGVGTININDAVAETVNLSLSDTQGTGLNVSSTQNVVFAEGGIDSFAKLLLHGDGANLGTTFTDSSLIPYTVTRVGLPTTSTTQVKFGTASMLFPGTGSRLSIPDSADWAFGTGDFTVDCWIYISAAPLTDTLYQIVGQVSSGGAQVCRLYYGDSGGTKQIVGDTENGGNYRLTVNQTIGLNGWHHIAWVRNGTQNRIYYDGTQAGVDYTNGYNFPDIAEPLYVGGNAYFSQDFVGFIDELRWSKGVSRWTLNFTPPNAAYSA